MARPDGRIEPGQPLRGAISARAWNRAQDAADMVLGSRTGFAADAAGGHAPYGRVEMLLQNTGMQGISPYTVVEITGVANQLLSAPRNSSGSVAYPAPPVLTGRFPTANIRRNYAIALNNIDQNQIGIVAVAGCTPCMVDAAYYSTLGTPFPAVHDYAKPLPGQEILQSSITGSARILYRLPGSGLTMVMLHCGTECIVANNHNSTWPWKTKRSLSVVNGYSGTAERELLYDPNGQAGQVDAWNFLGDIDELGCWNVLMPFFNDEYILVQSSYFTQRIFDSINDRFDAIEDRLDALESP